MRTCTVEIDLNQNGLGSVRVNGVDISSLLRGITISTEAGQPTKVTLRYTHDIEVRGKLQVDEGEINPEPGEGAP